MEGTTSTRTTGKHLVSAQQSRGTAASSGTRSARVVQERNAIADIMNKAAQAKFNVAGGWGDRHPMEAYRIACVSVASDQDRFHQATRYPPTAGLPRLREVIAEKLEAEVYGRHALGPENITIGSSSQAAFQFLALYCGNERPAVITDPLYANYLDQGRLQNTSMLPLQVFDPSSGDFLPVTNPTRVLASFRSLIERFRPRVLIIASPCNPTGQVWPDDLLDTMIRMARRNGVLVLLDRAYAPYYFHENPEHLHWSVRSHPNLVCIESFSKSFSLLGTRLGYTVAAPEVSDALQAFTQRNVLCAERFHQEAAADWLEDTSSQALKQYLEENKSAYIASYDLTRSTLLAGGLSADDLLIPDGGFYQLIRLNHGRSDDRAFCDHLFRKYSTLAVPGSAFGTCTRGWVRTAFAPYVRNHAKLVEAFTRVATAIHDLEVCS